MRTTRGPRRGRSHRQVKIEISEKLAGMVDEYNKLIDERRYPRPRSSPSGPPKWTPTIRVVMQMVVVSKALRRQAIDNSIRDRKGRRRRRCVSRRSTNRRSPSTASRIKCPTSRKWEALTELASNLPTRWRNIASPAISKSSRSSPRRSRSSSSKRRWAKCSTTCKRSRR